MRSVDLNAILWARDRGGGGCGEEGDPAATPSLVCINSFNIHTAPLGQLSRVVNVTIRGLTDNHTGTDGGPGTASYPHRSLRRSHAQQPRRS